MHGGLWVNGAAGQRGAWPLLGGDVADVSMVVAELEAAGAEQLSSRQRGAGSGAEMLL